MKVLELLSDKTKWCRHHCALDITRAAVSAHDPRATQFCLVGAIQRCYPVARDRYDAENKLSACLPKPFRGVACFNDSKKTTFRRLRAVIRKAGI